MTLDSLSPSTALCGAGIIQHPALGRRNPQVGHLEAGMIRDYTECPGFGDKSAWRSESPVPADMTSHQLVPELQTCCHIADG